MNLLKYPLLHIKYKPRKEILTADCLSRAQLPHKAEADELSGIIHTVTKSACISKDNYQFYLLALKEDENYSKICNYVETNWPTYHQLDDFSKIFHRVKDKLHFENGLLFLDHKLVIPTKLQRKFIIWLHEPHQGIEKLLSRARTYYYWPCMTKDLKEIVASCRICEKFKRNILKEPLMQEIIPRYPFHIVAMDLSEYAGKDFIALIDSYSGYNFGEQIKNKTSGCIILYLRSIFNIVGYPTIIKCDKSPLRSAEFGRFATKCNTQFKFPPDTHKVMG